MGTLKPNSWILRLLKWVCPAEIHEEIEGDVIQKFNYDVQHRGPWRARVRVVFSVLLFLRPGILLRSRFKNQLQWSFMFRSDVVTALRHMRKNKVFAGIIIFTLSVSMGACILIFQYASFELAHDRHLQHVDRLYRVNFQTWEGNVLQSEYASINIDPQDPISKTIAGVEMTAMFFPTMWWFDCSFTYHADRPRTFNERQVAYADPNVLNVFQYQIRKGNPATMLREPYTVVISESIAQKYFGDENPLGKVLHLRGSGDTHDFTVNGVVADPPVSSHVVFDILLSYTSLNNTPGENRHNGFLYVLLNEQSNRQLVDDQLSEIAAAFPAEANQRFDIVLDPVKDIHLYSKATDGQFAKGNPQLIYFLLAIAFLLLTLAWINYINLSFAQTFARAKEVGVRKTSGATRQHIVNQFVTETMVYNVTSLLLAIGVVLTVAPLFYNAVGISFPWSKLYWFDTGETGWIVLTIFCAGVLLSGLLPARLLSGLSPVFILKGKIPGLSTGAGFRKSAVVFQFICTIGLITIVIAFNRQFNLINQQDLGIDITRVMIVKGPTNADSTYRTKLGQFREALQQQSIIEKVFTGSGIFHSDDPWMGDMRRVKTDKAEPFLVNIIDPWFLEGFNIELLAGRNFEVADYPGDQFGEKIEPLIINETGARRLGFNAAEEAIGETMYWGTNECRIVGVIKDFHQRSLKQRIGPAFYTANNGASLSLQLSTGAMGENFKSSLVVIHNVWDQIFPENAFDFQLLSEEYNALYQTERQTKNLFQIFCMLALIISCLGLFALSLFALRQRAREMSIRKILGAPMSHLVRLLTHEYLLMVIIAAVIALPAAWWGLDQWLSGFALRVDINTLNIVLPLMITLLLAFLSVGIQTWRVAQKNPVDNLKV